MKNNKQKTYYFWTNEGLEFCGFYTSTDPGDVDQGAWGPFDSFSGCKLNAINFFKADIITCKNSLREIKKTRLKDVPK